MGAGVMVNQEALGLPKGRGDDAAAVLARFGIEGASVAPPA